MQYAPESLEMSLHDRLPPTPWAVQNSIIPRLANPVQGFYSHPLRPLILCGLAALPCNQLGLELWCWCQTIDLANTGLHAPELGVDALPIE
ncbi:hypothetical protein ACN4EG_13100 [Alkalinema pantanalense CENA528]|uniref:hypothetical protein n=1 Tax=Alkalinema pantanalense TaxID=1620705 RepID=UPI003D6F2322